MQVPSAVLSHSFFSLHGKTIAENEAEIKSIQEVLAKATAMCGDEHAEWEAADRDDGAAAELVMRAKDVLAGFYEENNLNLLQKSKKTTRLQRLRS